MAGSAVGPALGGALTQAFDWRAIFIFQAPIGAIAAVACLLERDVGSTAARRARAIPRGAGGALAMVSAALSAVLFLLVLMLVAGWSEQPLRAASP